MFLFSYTVMQYISVCDIYRVFTEYLWYS